jgi:hypothetical protein
MPLPLVGKSAAKESRRNAPHEGFPDWGSWREATDEVSLFNKEGGMAKP